MTGFDAKERARADAAFNWIVVGAFAAWVFALIGILIYSDSIFKVFGGQP